MQGNNIVKKQFILVPIPLENVVKSGIDLNDVIQTYAARGKIIIENADEDNGFVCDEDDPYDGDNPCDGDCENCPFFKPDCSEDEDCESCPCCCPECGECMCDAVMMEGEGEDE